MKRKLVSYVSKRRSKLGNFKTKRIACAKRLKMTRELKRKRNASWENSSSSTMRKQNLPLLKLSKRLS